MAKSSRSKWKKLHRRQRAQEVAATVQKRVERLHKKLELAANGGLSAMPMQDPETRFHFLNPEMDMNVPHNSKNLKNNYADLTRESLDFTKPLHLPPPRTNFYGKSNPDAPHPTTYQYEVVNASAPIAGHAISVEDEKRMMEKQQQQQQLCEGQLGVEGSGHQCKEEEQIIVGGENDANAMEEFVLGCNDAAWQTSSNAKAILLHGSSKARVKASQKAEAPRRISSMESPMKKKNRVVQVMGDKKMKRLSNIPTSRLKSGKTAAKKGG